MTFSFLIDMVSILKSESKPANSIFPFLPFLLGSTATSALPSSGSPGMPPVFLRSVNVAPFAGRTVLRSPRTKRKLPGMVAVMTLKFSHGSHLKLTSFDLQCFALDQRLRYFLVSRFDDSAKSLTGDLDLLRCLLLI